MPRVQDSLAKAFNSPVSGLKAGLSTISQRAFCLSRAGACAAIIAGGIFLGRTTAEIALGAEPPPASTPVPPATQRRALPLDGAVVRFR